MESAAFLCFGAMASVVAQSNAEEEVKKAVSAAELESLLVKLPNMESIVPQIEAALAADVRSSGVRERFLIKGVALKAGAACSLTMQEMKNANPNTVVSVVKEFQGDCMPISMSGSGVIPSVTGKIGLSESPLLGFSSEIYADSIYRFVGRVNLEGGFVLVGQGDKQHRLTFFALKDVGLVHLRGKGKLINPDGSEMPIGETNVR